MVTYICRTTLINLVRECDHWHIETYLDIRLRMYPSENQHCEKDQEGAIHLCSHQYKGDRDLQGHNETEESDVKSLGVMTGKRLRCYLEHGLLKKANQNGRE